MPSTPETQSDATSEQQPAGIEERLAAVEARIEELENAQPAEAETSTLWVVEALQKPRDHVPQGSVIFGGELDAAGKSYAYQWQRPTDSLTDPDIWAESFERLTALAHPVRGSILRRLLQSSAQGSDFIEEKLVTSPSTAYHHLSALTQAGWIKKSGSGIYEIAPKRVIPLLTIIAASEDH